MAVNWTTLVVLLMGLFALSGYFKGWWKEAITTLFLAILVLLLQLPDVARFIIDSINWVIAAIWSLLPVAATNFLETTLGLGSGSLPPEIDPGSSQTWIVILLIFIGLSILVGRFSMPGSARSANKFTGYMVTWGGRLFGALLGAVNAWLMVSLIRAYLDGSSLPSNQSLMSMDATAASPPATDVLVQAMDVPTASILDSFLPWLFVGLGLAVLIAALNSRYGIKDTKGYKKIDGKAPPGYKKGNVSMSG